MLERSYSAEARHNLRQVLSDSLSLFEPPKKITVSEWADTYRNMSSEETSRPGMWDTSTVPYMRFIMDVFSDEQIREITILKCTQIGGSEALINMLGYTIDQKPSRVMYVLPDDELCINFSDERLKKMFRSNTNTFGKKVDMRSKPKLIKFLGGFASIASARSPSELASWSVPIILLDEIDKYPLWSGKEANPIKLAEERTKNWPIAKIVKVSTPTIKTGAIYKSYESADVRYQFEVPCPHCGAMQVLKFPQLKWPKDENGESDPTVVRYQAYYECESCKGRIDDRHKPQMLKQGKWKALNTVQGKAASVAFHINSIYSPWLTFGKVAVEFLTSKEDPESLMNFVNSWLGEPWEDKASTLDSGIVLEKQTDIPEGVVPSWAQVLTAGVDVQKYGFYWTVRAWGYNLTSQNIAHGWAESFAEIDLIMNRFWPDEDGELRWQVNLCCVDSGYNTDEVYDFCLMSGGWAVPVKGASTQSVGRYKRSSIDSPGKMTHNQALYIVNGDAYKNMIASYLRRPMGRGSWMVYNGCDMDYAEQVTSEHKVNIVKGGRRVESWVPKTAHAANHYLDAEVYAACAADLLQVRYLEEPADVAPGENGRRDPPPTEGKDFIPDQGDNWL